MISLSQPSIRDNQCMRHIYAYYICTIYLPTVIRVVTDRQYKLSRDHLRYSRSLQAHHHILHIHIRSVQRDRPVRSPKHPHKGHPPKSNGRRIGVAIQSSKVVGRKTKKEILVCSDCTYCSTHALYYHRQIL